MVEFTPLEVSAWIKKLDPSRSMVLEGFPTRLMMMIMMMMMAVTMRHLIATSRGTSVTTDPIDRQKTQGQTYYIFLFLSLLLACILHFTSYLRHGFVFKNAFYIFAFV